MTEETKYVEKTIQLGNGRLKEVTSDGYILYKDSNGELHRPSQEGPAVIIPDMCVEFHEHNKFHRDIKEGPAVIWANGAYEYLVNNRRHNDQGPCMWTPFDEDDTVGYVVKFMKDQNLINDKDFCGPYFIEEGDHYFDLLKEDSCDTRLYLALYERKVIHDGKEIPDFWHVQTDTGPRLSHLIFMTKWVPSEIHQQYRLPQEKYDEIDWETELLEPVE